MKKRGSKPDNDSFDEEEWEDTTVARVEETPMGGRLLKADEVAMARFQSGRPGYSFKQVETFVKQVKYTLARHEQALYDKDIDLHDSKEENEYLQERIQNLQMTIEVFRAKGDPVVNADGSYVTESQLAGQGPSAREQELEQVASQLNASLAQAQADITRLNAELMAAAAISVSSYTEEDFNALNARIVALETDNANLGLETARLVEELAATAADRDAADAAEAAMREYVEVTLSQWIAGQGADATESESVLSPEESDTPEEHDADVIEPVVVVTPVMEDDNPIETDTYDPDDFVVEEPTPITVEDTPALPVDETPAPVIEPMESPAQESDGGVSDESSTDEWFDYSDFSMDDDAVTEETLSVGSDYKEEAAVAAMEVPSADREEYTSPFSAAASGHSNEWDDAPSIGNLEHSEPAANPNTIDNSPSERVEELPSAQSQEERINILLSSPEAAAANVDPSSLPMPTGMPMPGMPAPRKRGKASLDDAPELQ